jgi:hypothetical protein
LRLESLDLIGVDLNDEGALRLPRVIALSLLSELEGGLLFTALRDHLDGGVKPEGFGLLHPFEGRVFSAG